MRHLFAVGGKRDSLALREALAKKYGAKNESVALYHSGRSALSAALMMVGKKGSKVIIPGLTCIAVVRAVKAAGMEPVFVDITAENLEYDYKMLDKVGKACYNGIIVVQNTLGLPWDVLKIEKIAKKYHLTIVEDLAHSAGRSYLDGREVGTIGKAVALSFGKGKAIDTINGGAVVLRNGKNVEQPKKLPKLSERARDRWYPVLAGTCRGLWRTGIGKVMMVGFVKLRFVKRSADTELDLNVRLTGWQAKLALGQLGNLSNGPLREFRLVEQRKELLSKLNKAGYNFCEIWYDTPVSPARYSAEANFPVEECPTTVRIAEKIINLPTWYPERKIAKARGIIAQYEIGGKK